LSASFREVRDYTARHATFVVSRDLYKAIDNRRFETVLTSGTGRVAATIAYPRLVAGSAPPPSPGGHARPGPQQALLQLIRVDPEGQDVVLVFRVPEALDLGGPMQLRIGELSASFREVRDYTARHATFVVSRELYKAIDNRRFETVLTSGTGRVAATIAYPSLQPDRRRSR
jgi:hypothetical protein